MTCYVSSGMFDLHTHSLPLCRLRVFETGVMALQLQSHSEEAIVTDTSKAVCSTLVTDNIALLLTLLSSYCGILARISHIGNILH